MLFNDIKKAAQLVAIELGLLFGKFDFGIDLRQGVLGIKDGQRIAPGQWTIEASWKPENGGYRVRTRDGALNAANVVVATGLRTALHGG